MDTQNQPPEKPDQDPEAQPDEKPRSTIPGRNKITRVELLVEAFKRHAETRAPRGPAKEMPVTPTLPKVPKPARQRKRDAAKNRHHKR